MSASRKDVLLQAIEAEVGGESVDLGTLFTDDVVGWSPYASVSGLTALAELALLREVAFSNVVVMFRGLDEVGNKAFAEWVIEADHTGPLVLSEDAILEATGRHVELPGVTVADFRDGKIRSYRTYFDDISLIEQYRRRLTRPARWSSTSRTIRIRSTSGSSRRRSAVRRLLLMGLGDEVELAIFVREAGRIVAGISGWTWGDCCELQSLWVEPSLRGRWLGPRLLAAAEVEAAARGCTQTVHFTYDFQARRLYEWAGYELVGRVEDFPSGTDALWYRKRLKPT